MMNNKLLLSAAVAGLLLSPLAIQAAEPVSNIGLMGSISRYDVSTDTPTVNNNKQRMPKGGIYYNYGNKMTGKQGLVYQAGAEAQYGKRGDVKERQLQVELDLGYRFDVGNSLYLDGIAGAGYQHNKFDDKKGVDLTVTNKSPFVKAAVGLNHEGNTLLSRLEIGTRYNIEAESRIKAENSRSATADLKGKYSPYAELNFMWDKGYNNMPLTAGVYYMQNNYQLKDRHAYAKTKLKNEEIGLKVGLAF